jgi:hypothetical protein
MEAVMDFTTQIPRTAHRTSAVMAAFILTGSMLAPAPGLAQARPTLASLQAAVDCLNLPTTLVTIPAKARGSYYPSGVKVPGDNFLVGRVVSGSSTLGPFRNYFVFELSNSPNPLSPLDPVRDLVLGGSLVTYNPPGGFQSDSSDTLTFVLNRVTALASSLMDGTAGSGGYLDLADGQDYGRFVASPAQGGSLSIELTNQAIRDINHTLLPSDFFHLFTIGGSIQPLPVGSDNAYFLHNNTFPLTNTALVLNVRRYDVPGLGTCLRPTNTQYQR